MQGETVTVKSQNLVSLQSRNSDPPRHNSSRELESSSDCSSLNIYFMQRERQIAGTVLVKSTAGFLECNLTITINCVGVMFAVCKNRVD